MQKPIVILGSGIAGYNLAREIREKDKDIPVLMITQDAGDFYSKPMLSTALSFQKTPEMLMSATAKKMAEQYHMEIVTHTHVEQIIPEEKTLISNSSPIEYSNLILCVGADTHTPVLEGDASLDVLQVNDVYQYQTFREKITAKKNITLIGAGLVGCEFANDLTRVGHQVHVIELTETPLATLLPPEIGLELKTALEQQGVQWHLQQQAKAIYHQENGYRVALGDGSSFNTEVVFSAIGLKPRIELAKKAGVLTRRGILVNDYLETNINHIYAMGDCAEIKEGWLLPYITPTLHAAKALAETLTGVKKALSLPAIPVMIKTSCYPIAVCRPPFAVNATWAIEKHENHLRAYLRDKDNQLWGFILTKDAVGERKALAQTLEKWL